MSDISHHILHFIALSDAVIIPGFGKLYRSYHPAELNPFENRLSPPFYTLNFEFSFQEDENDLLINYISEKENICFEDAAELVYLYKKEILNRLFNKESVDIDGIGSYSYNGGEFYFNAVNDNPLLNPYYGFSDIQAVPIKREKLDVEETPSKKKKFKIGIPLLLGILSVPILIIIATYVPFKRTPKITFSNTEVVIDSLSENYIKDSTASIKSDSLQSETVKEENLIEPSTKEYFIVVGTFADEENAKRTEKRLNADGYTCNLKKYNNGKVRVAVALKVANESELKEKLDHIKSNYEKGAFVVKN